MNSDYMPLICVNRNELGKEGGGVSNRLKDTKKAFLSYLRLWKAKRERELI